MPQITYIDTDAPRRERHSQATISSRTVWRWKSAARWIARHRLAILAAMALYRFIGLGMSEMQQWGESIYALRTRVILEFGAIWDQSSFMPGGVDYSAHPPLSIWLSTSFLLLFGDQLWVYRLTSAIAAALLVPLLYRLSRMMQSPVKSLVVTGLFAFAPLPALLSRHGGPDLLLTLCMTAALYFALRALRDGRTVDILLAGCTLGAALMTRLLFPLSIPAAVVLSALFLEGSQRNRALRTALLMTLISLPLWLPWAWTFAVKHGEGADFLLSATPPFSTAFAGVKEVASDSTVLYYLNQLIINVGLLLPFAVLSIWRSLVPPRHAAWTVTTLVIIAGLVVLWALPSAFELFIIPILPLLFIHAVRGVSLLKRATRPLLLSISMASAICLAWSLAPSWREALPGVVRGISDGAIMWDAVVSGALLLLATAAVLLTVWQLYRRNRLRPLLSLPLTGTVLLLVALTTCVRIWLIVPAGSIDGAANATAALRASNATLVFLIGDGDNPQLTSYLSGADIGWREEEHRRYERLEPHAIGVEGIYARIASVGIEVPVAVLIERNELTQELYDAEREMLPPGFSNRLRTGRYIIAGSPRLTLGGDPVKK